MNQRLERTTVGDIVAADFRAAAIFEDFGIDFCCGGQRSVVDACRTASADPDEVMRAIDALGTPDPADDDARHWTLDRLIDHIVVKHHGYVRQALPAIARHLAKLQQVHGERHPELARVASIFGDVSDELSQHLIKEEQVLFPYIRDLAGREKQSCGGAMSPFGTIENPIRMMEREHQDAGDALDEIRDLTSGYATPGDGCTTYAVAMTELLHFERDLHRHIHLENNILFPRAVALENGPWDDDRH